MPGTVVTFWDAEIIPNHNVSATFQAQITFENEQVWWVDRIDLGTFKRTLSDMPVFEPLSEHEPFCGVLREFVNRSKAGRAEVEAQIDREVSDCGGWREMGRMAAE